MSIHDKTLKLVTNLDRAAIEAKLSDVRNAAKAAGLDDLATLFADVHGAPRASLEQRVGNAMKWLANKPEHGGIRALLELVELNLKNLQ